MELGAYPHSLHLDTVRDELLRLILVRILLGLGYDEHLWRTMSAISNWIEKLSKDVCTNDFPEFAECSLLDWVVAGVDRNK